MPIVLLEQSIVFEPIVILPFMGKTVFSDGLRVGICSALIVSVPTLITQPQQQ